MKVTVTWQPEYVVSEFDISEDDKNQMHNEGVNLEDGVAVEAWLEKQEWFKEEIIDHWNEVERSLHPEVSQVEITSDEGWII